MPIRAYELIWSKAYDYSGPWTDLADNQSNLYGDGDISTDKAVKYYIANGATASKINIGIPLYGRVFQNTKGLGQPYDGVSVISHSTVGVLTIS